MAAHREPRLTVACIQLTATTDYAANIDRAAQLVSDAVERGARLIVLPEKWHMPGQPKLQQQYAQPLDGELIQAVRGWAARHGVWVHNGSFVERRAGHDRTSNTSVLCAPDGSIAATYRKIHMFDVTVDGVAYRESATDEPGAEGLVVTTDMARIGMSICYDLRFPELYRALASAGANILVVPSCFTRRTGQDHWEVLLRARAIENGCFVLAPNIIGDHGRGRQSYGRSMIVDPWGVVLATAPDDDAVVLADLSFQQLDRVRSAIPTLDHRVPDAYSNIRT